MPVRSSVLLALVLSSSVWAAPGIPGLRALLPAGRTGTPGEVAAEALATEGLGAEPLAPPAGGPLAIPGDTRALWWHCESWPLPTDLTDPEARAALLAWLAEGHGLLLSGTALAYAADLGLESATPRALPTGASDAIRAGLDPSASPGHPIWEGFAKDAPIWLTGGGFGPSADFHGSAPAGGVVIGRAAPDAGENPLVEYAYGKGRVLVLGWRLPHYGAASGGDRESLERFTGNVLRYLAAGTWHGDLPDARRQALLARLGGVDPEPLRLMVEDLRATFGPRYPRAEEYLARIARLEGLREGLVSGDDSLLGEAEALARALREIPLDNPLLDFDRLLLVRRSEGNLGLPQNWESNSSLPRGGFDNEIATLAPVGPGGELRTVYRPPSGGFVGDVDLHPSGGRMLFSMPRAPDGAWRVWEMGSDGSGLAPIGQVDEPDVDNYDACYLPDGNILFTSTAPFVGVPCVTGASHVANLFLLDNTRGGEVRALTFDQEHNWCPTAMNDGRVLYQRWEYSDIPHFAARLLFTMNPDGTDQRAFYGSNSYWPDAMFYARPIPDDPNRVIAVVGGHHDNPRMGELVLFDAAQGQYEADGVIQRIPGRGKTVESVILDGLTLASWPKFLHPYPLSGKYFLVSCKPSPARPWGIYLADVFDNLTLVKEIPGQALLEPVPLRPTAAPRSLPPRSHPGRHDALVNLSSVYIGPGLAGVPRGSIKKLRLVTYHFSYHGMGGQTCRIGFDGPWDIKRVLGTVPVEEDGSALFRVPANTPISIQPLDENGQALQLMRSWFTAMPGETLSCVGCHEPRGTAPPPVSLASLRAPSEIAPWYGPTRGFSFAREVQPVLDRYCTACHDGHTTPEGRVVADLRPAPQVRMGAPEPGYDNLAWFPPSYLALKQWVRNATMESDLHLLMPGEYAADTTRLVRVLREGHHGVRLSPEAWDRLTTWIDLNTPAQGTWTEIVGAEAVLHQRDRRQAMLLRYGGRDEDPEAILPTETNLAEPVPPAPVAPRPEAPALAGWPLSEEEARRAQEAEGPTERTLDLGEGVALTLRRIPAGAFVMGDPEDPGESPGPRVVRIDQPYWIGAFEVTNAQFARFDPGHESRLESGDFLQFGIPERGWPVDAPEQPAVRLSALEAEGFCRWLGERAGLRVALPSEEQWEYACRAGSAARLWFGPVEADFAPYANLADSQLRRIETHAPWGLPSGAIPPWRPAVETVDDGFRVSAPVGAYRPNPWGLHDMHGNAAEWTRSTTAPPGGPTGALERVVRGGSWYDLPRLATAGYRTSYPAYRGVYDVGFRVVVEDAGP